MTPIPSEDIVHTGDLVQANVPNGLMGRAVALQGNLIEVAWSDGQRLHHTRPQVLRHAEPGLFYAHRANPGVWGECEDFDLADGRPGIRTPDGRLRRSILAAWRPVQTCRVCGGVRGGVHNQSCPGCQGRGYEPAGTLPLPPAFPAWSRPAPVGAFAVGQAVRHCKRPGRWFGLVTSCVHGAVTVDVGDADAPNLITRPSREWKSDRLAKTLKPLRRFAVGDLVALKRFPDRALRVLAVATGVDTADGDQGLTTRAVTDRSGTTRRTRASLCLGLVPCAACGATGCPECHGRGYVDTMQPPHVNRVMERDGGQETGVVRESTNVAFTVQVLPAGPTVSVRTVPPVTDWRSAPGKTLCSECHGVDSEGCLNCNGLGWLPIRPRTGPTVKTFTTTPLGSHHIQPHGELNQPGAVVLSESRAYITTAAHTGTFPDVMRVGGGPSVDRSTTALTPAQWVAAAVVPGGSVHEQCRGYGCTGCGMQGYRVTGDGVPVWAVAHVDVIDPDLGRATVVLNPHNVAATAAQGTRADVARPPFVTLTIVATGTKLQPSLGELAEFRTGRNLAVCAACQGLGCPECGDQGVVLAGTRAQVTDSDLRAAYAVGRPVITRRLEHTVALQPPEAPTAPAADPEAYTATDESFAARRRRRRPGSPGGGAPPRADGPVKRCMVCDHTEPGDAGPTCPKCGAEFAMRTALPDGDLQPGAPPPPRKARRRGR